MADPIAIVGLLATVATVTARITKFVQSIREAHDDLDHILNSLNSLSTILDLIRKEQEDTSRTLPQFYVENLPQIVAKCDDTISDIQRVLDKYENAGPITAGARWAVSGKGDMETFKARLEMNIMYLDLALNSMAWIHTIEIKHETAAIRTDATKIRGDTAGIKQDTDRILQEIASLVARLPPEIGEGNESKYMVERYLEELTSYTEGTLDTIERFIGDYHVPDSPTEENLDSDSITPLPSLPESSSARARSSGTSVSQSMPSIAQSTGTGDNHPDQEGWNKINVLTFDGGGTRGFYSLLHLNKLMELIAEEEERLGPLSDTLGPPQLLSSFSPLEAPANVSHRNPPEVTPFLPCHYFDYISGTSTGALIAIMLSRLRMPVKDCLEEFKRFASVVFAQPRDSLELSYLSLITVMRLRLKTKYATSTLENAVKDLVNRRGEEPLDRDTPEMMLKTPRGMCRAIILVTRSIEAVEHPLVSFPAPIVVRSYNRYIHGQLRSITGPWADLTVWKLGRAATASRFYFKPLSISSEGEVVRDKRDEKRISKSSSIVQLSDAAMELTNPSHAVYQEVRSSLSKFQRIGTWVSIGVAQRENHAITTGRLTLLRMKGLSSGADKVHSQMIDSALKRDESFSYYRFDEPGGLSGVALDDWLPRGSGEKFGGKTIRIMEQSFENYFDQPGVKQSFQQCARWLVTVRRQRIVADISRWERYALGTTYTCRQSGCKYEDDMEQTWNYRDQFTTHLQTDHSLSTEDEINAACQAGSIYWRYKSPTLQ
ncbi:acyl transferase/acyl hydrolase/lysophospholipase [Podospora fimiseda]|uniref:Acyl transferase/acyl hydrolase/lysophospholipase n=1 Tax=Podospora fimiseda TaxID=252190 RepID=A0AAN7BKA4_9PEZI|nr:acyl transferase/acyl hydrolase/lysophospholipase [Podospora fimiseda]